MADGIVLLVLAAVICRAVFVCIQRHRNGGICGGQCAGCGSQCAGQCAGCGEQRGSAGSERIK